MIPFPSKSLQKAMWQTPVSMSRPSNSTPVRFELAPGFGDVRHADRDPHVCGTNSLPTLVRLQRPSVTFVVSNSGKASLGRRRLVQPEQLPVEPPSPGRIARGDGDEVDPLDFDQPTDPSIWSWISRFSSTAYSSGSSFVIGSTKPETIIAAASASESPRLIR